MTEKLKTVKDFDVEGEFYNHDEAVIKELISSLKAEAVKWVREYDKVPAMREGLIQGFIMEFFNLTEEDLK